MNPSPRDDRERSDLSDVILQPFPLAALVLAILVIIGAIFVDAQYDRWTAEQARAALNLSD